METEVKLHVEDLKRVKWDEEHGELVLTFSNPSGLKRLWSSLGATLSSIKHPDGVTFRKGPKGARFI